MNLLQLSNGNKSFGAKAILRDANFSINSDEHVGVVGPNGAGKTTLFKILLDSEGLDSGVVIKKNNLKVAYLEQESDWNLKETAETYLQSLPRPFWEVEKKGLELGLTPSHLKQELATLSGGFRMRVRLLALWAQAPDLMLLDEPTNFLDLETVLVVEEFLQNFTGAYLLISHDREFLRKTTDHILELDQGETHKYPGNIEDYFEQKNELQEMLRKRAMNIAEKRAAMQSFVDRFRAKATKAKQAQSRLKALEKMEVVEVKNTPIRAKIKIPSPIHCGREMIQVQDLSVGYSTPVLGQINLQFRRGDKLGIVGLNGAGKSTFLKALAGVISPLAGNIHYGKDLRLSLFSQHSSEVLNLDESIMESLQAAAHPDILNQDILDLAGALLFSGDDIHKKIRVLSGGEKSRVALARILLQKNNLLLLDEPTNHLDFETVEALTQALVEYEGSLLIVSHDRSFISRIASRILEVHNGKVETYNGTYDEYVWSLAKGVLAERNLAVTNTNVPVVSTVLAKPKVNFKQEQRRLEQEALRLKREIQKQETLLNDLQNQIELITQSLQSTSGPQASALAKELGSLGQKLSHAEEQLLSLMMEQDETQRQIKELQS